MIQMLLTSYAGFTHAFETDHLLAVGNIVTSRSRLKMAMKDGMYWGLGHTSTIMIIGLAMIVFRMNISDHVFRYFEAAVGSMLIALAIYRLFRFWRIPANAVHTHLDGTTHVHGHKLAYGVGLVHGLAGSGALVVLVMSQIKKPTDGIIYLLIFGLGSMVGMLVAAGLFSMPFSKKLIKSNSLQTILILVSCALCIFYGGRVIYDNYIALI